MTRVERAIEAARTIRFLIQKERRLRLHDLPKSNLEGACSLSACRIAMLLNDPSVVRNGHFDGEPHSWVEVDNVIIDCTVTQFGAYPRVARFDPDHPTYQLYTVEQQGLDAINEILENKWIERQVDKDAINAFLYRYTEEITDLSTIDAD